MNQPVTAVLFCPARYADSVALIDRGWSFARYATPERKIWVTPEGEHVHHVSQINDLLSRGRNLRVYIGYGAERRDLTPLPQIARHRNWTIIEEWEK